MWKKDREENEIQSQLPIETIKHLEACGYNRDAKKSIDAIKTLPTKKKVYEEDR